MQSKFSVFIIVGLILGGLVGYYGVSNILSSQINDLISENSNLNLQCETLSQEYAELYDEYNEITRVYNDLKVEYTTLQQQIVECHGEDIQNVTCPEVIILTNQDYYHSLKADLANAKKSIMVAMYSMKYDPGDDFDWANDLIEELVYAHNRGVNVTVLIEYQTYFGYQEDNYEAYEFLSSNGVFALLDYDNDTDHLKSVLIDYTIWYVGSHNWSESSLYYNNEISVKIVT